MARFLFIWLLYGLPLVAVGQKEFVPPCDKLDPVRELLHQDEIREAIQALEKIKPQTPTCQAEYSLLRGELRLYQSDYATAQTDLAEALDQFSLLQSESGIVRASYQLSLAYIEDGQGEKALSFLDKALQLKTALGIVNLLHEALDLRAMLYSNAGNHAAAMNLLKEALQYSQARNDLSTQSQLLNQISTNYQSLGKIDSAIFYYQKLIGVKKLTQDRQGLLSDYSTLGGLYRELGSYREAQEAFIHAISHAEELQDTLSQVTIYIDIAHVYLEGAVLAPALEYARKALTLARENNMGLSHGNSLAIKGEILQAYNRLQEASADYTQALTIYQSLGLQEQSANMQVKLAGINPSNSQLEKAAKALREVLQTRLESGDKLGELNTKLMLSNITLQLKKLGPELERWLSDSEQLAYTTSNRRSLQEVYRLKSLLSEQRGNYRLALQQYQIHKVLQDSILNQDNSREVRRLEKQFETAKREKELAETQVVLEQQQRANEQQKNALKTRNTQIFFLLLGIFLLMALIGVIAYANRRNKLLNQQRMSILEKEKETEVLRAMVVGEEQERLRIARDLHDGLGAIMATIKMRMGALGDQLPQIKAQESYQKAGELIDEAYNGVREVSHNMIPGSIRKFGLERAVANTCTEVEQTHGLAIEYIPYGLEDLDNDVIATNVYRIVQELLQNIIKHAAASEVIVQLTLEDDLFMLVVEDNGKGFDMKTKELDTGIGIGSIRSRVLFLQGEMDIDSVPNEGTTFSITFPMNPQQQASKA